MMSSEDGDVQKLKDLVKRLEKQNEHLRNRTDRLSGNSARLTKSSKSSTRSDDVITSDDDFETIEIDDFTETDECTWLYDSPIKVKNDDVINMNIKQWMTSEIENPSSPHLISAKRNIIAQLERVVPSFDDVDRYKIKRETPDDDPVDLKMEEKSYQAQRSSPKKIQPIETLNRQSMTSSSFHNLPIPSQTMTSAYDLVSNDNRKSIQRSMTPNSANFESTSRISPQSKQSNLRRRGVSRGRIATRKSATRNRNVEDTKMASEQISFNRSSTFTLDDKCKHDDDDVIKILMIIIYFFSASGDVMKTPVTHQKMTSSMSLRKSLPRPSHTSVSMNPFMTSSKHRTGVMTSHPDDDIWGNDEAF